MAEVEYTIRRSPRARRSRVKVDPYDGVEVVIPQRATKREAQAAIKELRPWIDRRLAEAHRAKERLSSPPGTVPFLGAHLRIHYDESRTRAHRRRTEKHFPATDADESRDCWFRTKAR